MRNTKTALLLMPILLVACGNEGNTGPTAGTSSVPSGGSSVSGGSGGSAGTVSGGGILGTSGGTSGEAPVPSAGTNSGGTGSPASAGAPATGGTTPAEGGATPGGGSGGSAAGAPEETAGSGGTGGAPPGSTSCPYTPPKDPDTFPKNWTRADVTKFNDNGGWTWYNDERVVVDADQGKIILSTAASSASSQSSSPQIHAVIHDLATGTNQKATMGSLSYSDDHNNGGIVITSPGKYFVGWAHHNVDCLSHWKTYANGTWSQEQTFRWNSQGCPWGSRPDNITYNNPWKMSSEGKFYNFVRSVQTSPTFLVSEDEGETWTFGGRLTASPQQGYNAGYYKYWGNGVDRIDFFATEAHPRDANTSVFHGYVKGGKSYDSFGEEKDANVNDSNAPQITAFTRVFGAGGQLGGVTLRRLWNFDIARYDDGTIGVLWQGRENECPNKNNCTPGHHIAYSRFDGTAWKSTRLVAGGRTLYRNRSDWWEEDYLGGAALHPDDPNVVYVSSPIDPRDESKVSPNHEIWKGVTCDNGATFQWEPITQNSQNDNLRPAVPKWNAQNSVVVWFRGNYQTAQMYSAEVVGIITRPE